MAEEKDSNLSHPAKVRLANAGRRGDLLDLVSRSWAGSEASDSLYFWDAEISNDLLDSHFTHMSEKTLANYVEDANKGVAFLRGHNWHELPIGYSLEATLETKSGRKRVMAGFYTTPEIPEGADLIKRMEAKILRDVSVGFHGGRMVCDLCGQDFWDCRHFPGLKYETKEGDVVKTELATFTIDDARLSEVSGVFDGSTPEAMIRKAQRHAAQGLLDPKQIEILQERYRTRLVTFKSWSITDKGERYLMDLNREKKMDEKQVDRLKGIVIASGIVPEEQRASLDEEAILVYVDKLAARVQTLESQAEEGRQYRTDLVAGAIAEGVRAHGNDFDAAGYQATLESAPLATVKRMAADWKKVADTVLPAGRHSEDTATNTQKPQVELVPDEAYF